MLLFEIVTIGKIIFSLSLGNCLSTFFAYTSFSFLFFFLESFLLLNEVNSFTPSLKHSFIVFTDFSIHLSIYSLIFQDLPFHPSLYLFFLPFVN